MSSFPLSLLLAMLKKVKKHCKHAFSYLLSRATYKGKTPRVIIFAEARSGSTLLESLLDSTKYFRGCSEILNGADRANPLYPFHFLQGYSQFILWRHKRACLCHIKPSHLKHLSHRIDANQFLERCHQAGWFIIHLQRRNVVLQALSSCVALANKRYHFPKGTPEFIPVNIRPENLIRIIDFHQDIRTIEQESVRGIPTLDIWYEDHLLHESDHQQTIDTILQAMNLERRKTFTPLQKIVSNPEELIENYTDIKNVLYHLKLDHLLDAKAVP